MRIGLRNYHRLMNEAGAGDAGGGVEAGESAAPVAESTGGSVLGGEPSAAPASAPTPEPPGVSIPDNWKDALPQEFRDDPSLKPISNLEGLVKSYIHSQKMIGRGKMAVPDEHASDDDWRQVYQTLGLPENMEDYSFDVPEDAQFEDGFISKLKEVGYEQGILPKQMKGLVDWYAKANNEALASHEAQLKVAREEGLSGLKKEWGQAFDQRVNLARAAIRASENSEQVFDWLNETGLGDDPHMIKFLSAMGQMLKEDNLVSDVGETVESPKELQSRVEELQNSKAYLDRQHPNHQKVIKEMESLFQRMHPNQKKADSLTL